MNMPVSEAWPSLHYDTWGDTCTSLHLRSQIVGKIRLATTPWLNHSWHVALYVTARGLTTSPMAHGSLTFEIQFDFIEHALKFTVSDGRTAQLDLKPQSIADFKAAVMNVLADLRLHVAIRDRPCEIADALSFSEDRVHASYDAAHAQRFWRALVQADRVFKLFRTRFLGKCSPVHFFWGSFDLAVSRFSGRRAPLHPGHAPGVAPIVMQEAYSHEVCSAGFWPGGGGLDASFYAYAYPEPLEFKAAPVLPAAASYNDALHEFLLPYEAVRTAADPDTALLGFLQSTYEAAANTANWDRVALECASGQVGICRRVS
jgi:hypothetical protein